MWSLASTALLVLRLRDDSEPLRPRAGDEVREAPDLRPSLNGDSDSALQGWRDGARARPGKEGECVAGGAY